MMPGDTVTPGDVTRGLNPKKHPHEGEIPPDHVTARHRVTWGGSRVTAPRIPTGGRGALGCSTLHRLNGFAWLITTKSLLRSLHRYGRPTFVRCLARRLIDLGERRRGVRPHPVAIGVLERRRDLQRSVPITNQWALGTGAVSVLAWSLSIRTPSNSGAASATCGDCGVSMLFMVHEPPCETPYEGQPAVSMQRVK